MGYNINQPTIALLVVVLSVGAVFLSPYCLSVVEYTSHLVHREMAEGKATDVYGFTVKDSSGQDVSLEKYRGKVLLIVNVASLCGLTATNYKELVQLDEKYRDKGLSILAFPCNQFGSQEPGNSEEVVCFAKKHNANFDVFEKIDVNGATAHPLYKYLKEAEKGWFGNAIKWNFTKFIVNKQGIPVERFSPTTPPSKLIPALEKYLAA